MTAFFPELHLKSHNRRQNAHEAIVDEAEQNNYLVCQKWNEMKEKLAKENKYDFVRENKTNVISDYSHRKRGRMIDFIEKRDESINYAKRKK